MIFVPQGFAHGIITLTDDTEAFYLVNAFYAPEQERGFRFDDPRFRHRLAAAARRSFAQGRQLAGLRPRLPRHRTLARPDVRILLTGGSSFTGLWFARSLAARGHTRRCPAQGQRLFGLARRPRGRARRVAEVVEDCPFGSDRFLDLAGTGSWDLLCQHAAQTGDYRNPDFDVIGAVADNTKNLAAVLKKMMARGPTGVVLTGSVFEQDEGAGDAPLRAFSPYGLSKGLTWQYYRFLSETLHFNLGKFVIANPIGPFEEPRFCNYLIRYLVQGRSAGRCGPPSTCATTFMSICWRKPTRPLPRACPRIRASRSSIRASMSRARARSRNASPLKCHPALGSPAPSRCCSRKTSPNRWSGSTPTGSTGRSWAGAKHRPGTPKPNSIRQAAK